ncbi:FkbM family methyltransferase [Salinibacter ruber]|uniref:FkbM family methyltransferase n=1 Tax=Salinibacter ruber TaxID=146919 RepID=UPI003C6E3054
MEPDPDNFSVLRKNTRAFRERVRCINSGVWSHRVGLKVERGSYRDGREWTTRVRTVTDGEEADLQATSIADVMQEHGLRSVDFLKIDIEGTEVALFDQGYERWLPHLKAIAIELHGDEAEGKLNGALSDVPASFRSATYGETTLLIQE